MHSELYTAEFVLLVHSTIEGATLHVDKLPGLPPRVNLDWYHSVKLIKIKDEHKHIAYSTLNYIYENQVPWSRWFHLDCYQWRVVSTLAPLALSEKEIKLGGWMGSAVQDDVLNKLGSLIIFTR